MRFEVDEYVEYIKAELEQLVESKFCGNVEFKINFKDGLIFNMNCSLNKSVRLLQKGG